jgi:WD40 repeat protein
VFNNDHPNLESTLDDIDNGDDTQNRYYYQHVFTAILSLELLKNDNIECIYCEHHEDVNVKLTNEQYIGYQVKTRDRGELFKSNDEDIINTIKRFIDHENKFPKQFYRYVIVTNCGFWQAEKNSQNFPYILGIVHGDIVHENVDNKSLLDYAIKGVSKKCNCNEDKLLDILKKTYIHDPNIGINDIDTKLNEEIKELDNVYNIKYISNINLIANELKIYVIRASSLKFKGNFFELLSDPNLEYNKSIIEGKKISKEILNQILIKFSDNNIKTENSSLFLKLKPIDYTAEINYYLNKFIGRDWIFRDVNNWIINNDSRILFIIGMPGTGKSATSAWLVKNFDQINAYHFFEYDKNNKKDTRRCICSIAYRLCKSIPEYEEILMKMNLDDIDNLNGKTLFDYLLVQPLNKLLKPKHAITILIDAIDEASDSNKNEFMDILGSELKLLPEWFKIIITSRPNSYMMNFLACYSISTINLFDSRNEEDIRNYLNRELTSYITSDNPNLIEELLKKCNGIFLYAVWAVIAIQRNQISPNNLDELPNGLNEIYNKFFERQFSNETLWNESIRPALEIICASQKSQDFKMLSLISGWDVYDQINFQRQIGPLFTFDINNIKPFHKSIIDWVTDKDKAGRFYISINNGHNKLADFGWQEYQKGIINLSNYFIIYLPLHLVKIGKWKEVELILTDLKYLIAKCNLVTIYDIIEDYELIINNDYLKNNSTLLEYRTFLLNQSHILSKYPDLLLQQATNEQYFKKLSQDALNLVNADYMGGTWLQKTNGIKIDYACISTFEGHTDIVLTCKFSSDYKLIASVSLDKTVKIWDVKTGKNLTTFNKPDDAIFDIIILKDNLRALSISANTARFWNIITGEEIIPPLYYKYKINRYSISPNEASIIIPNGKIFNIINLKEGIIKETVNGHNTNIIICGYSPDGNIIVSISEDNIIKFWNSSTYEEIISSKIQEHSNLLIFSPNGTKMAIVSDNGFTIWDMGSRKIIFIYTDYHDMITCCSFSQSEDIFVTTSGVGTLEIWDINTRRLVKSINAHTNYINYCSFSNDGKLLVTVSRDMFIKVWNTATWTKLSQSMGHSAGITNCDISSDNLLITASEDHTLKLWDIKKSITLYNQPRFFNMINELGYISGVNVCALSPDGNRFLTEWGIPNVYHNSTFIIEDLQNSNYYRHLDGSNSNGEEFWDINKTIFALFNDKVVLCSSRDGLKIWDFSRINPKIINQKSNGHNNYVSSCDLSPNGRYIASVSWNKTIIIWDTENLNEQKRYTCHNGKINDCAISPSGKYLVTASDDKTLSVLDIESNKNILILRGHNDIVSKCVFSPDDKYILSGSNDKTMKLWDITNGSLLHTYEGHNGIITVCSFSPNGEYILSGSNDGLVKLWSVHACKNICNYWVGGFVKAIAWNPDGDNFKICDNLGNIHSIKINNANNKPIIATSWQFNRSQGIFHRKTVKITAYGCPKCKRWININEFNIGTNVQCPYCSTTVKLNLFVIEADWRPIALKWYRGTLLNKIISYLQIYLI